MTRLQCLLAGVLIAAGLTATAGDWPQFRGPGGAGLTAETNLPTTWAADKNVAWKAKLTGRGWSSPIVWKGKIYITSASSELDGRNPMGGGRGGPPGGGGGPPGGGRGGGGGGGFGGGKPPDVPFKFEVVCFDLATGNEVWRKLALEAKPRIAIQQQENTYASETPVTDGERVYAYFGMTGLFCYDLAGNPLWKKDLGAFRIAFGSSSSPVLADGKLFVLVDNDEKSFLVALDGKTGDQVWKMDRPEKSNYSTPLVWKNKSRTELVVAGSPKVRSYDLASGKQLWELTYGSGQCSASPVGTEDLLYVGIGGGPGGGGGRGPGAPGGQPPGGGAQPPGGGRGGPGGGVGGAPGLYAVKAGADGDLTPKAGETTSPGVAWSAPRAGVSRSTPLIYQGYVYLLEQNGMVNCFDAKTGKPAYTKERVTNAAFWASPWGHDGKVFCLDNAGTTHVLQAGPEFKLLGTNKLPDTTRATPALAGGAVIIRGAKDLYCIKQ